MIDWLIDWLIDWVSEWLIDLMQWLTDWLIDWLGVVEADPEYLLIVEANNLAADIDHEMNTVHKYAR